MNDETHLRENICHYSLSLLDWTSEKNFKTFLGSLSHKDQVKNVLEELEFQDKFDTVVCHDDENKSKPNTEMYCIIEKNLI